MLFKNKVVKKIIVLAVITFTMAAYTGCDKKDEKSISENEAIEIVESVKSQGKFDSGLTSVSPEVISNLYKLTDDKIEVIEGYMGDGASAEEIVLFKGEKSKVKEAVDTYLKEKEDNYASYLPKEADKVKQAVCRQYGKYTIICISADSNEVKSIMSSHRQ